MNYDWDFSVLLVPKYREALAYGLWISLQLTAVSILVGSCLGIMLGILSCIGGASSPTYELRHARSGTVFTVYRNALRLLRWLIIVYIDVVRAIPLLVLILAIYYLLPVLIFLPPFASLVFVVSGTAAISVPTFVSAATALSINLSAFVADLVRAATAGVPSGSVLAARSLGMHGRLIWRCIILPDVARQILPSMTLLYITILKMSTLASVIAVYELLHSAESIIHESYRPLEVYLAVAALFVMVVVPLSILARWLETTRYFRRRG